MKLSSLLFLTTLSGLILLSGTAQTKAKEPTSPTNQTSLPNQDEETEGRFPKDYTIPDGLSVPQAEQLNASDFKIGHVIVSAKDKTITFDGSINMNEGLIEYGISMPHGKCHEALLVTLTDPLQISVASKLLNMPVIKGIFPERDDNMEWLPFNPPTREKIKPALVSITVSWKDDKGKTITKDLGDLLVFKSTKHTLSKNEFALIDSSLYRNIYQASVLGDIVSIYGDPNTFIAYTGFANDGENVWMANKDILPKIGTPVTITIKALSKEEANKPISVRPTEDTSVPSSEQPY